MDRCPACGGELEEGEQPGDSAICKENCIYIYENYLKDSNGS